MRNELEKYRSLNIKVLEAISNEEYEEVVKILEEKNKIIKLLDNMEYDKSEFKDIAEELSLLNLDKQVAAAINIHKDIVKKKINDVSVSKVANTAYNSSFLGGYNNFNRKI